MQLIQTQNLSQFKPSSWNSRFESIRFSDTAAAPSIRFEFSPVPSGEISRFTLDAFSEKKVPTGDRTDKGGKKGPQSTATENATPNGFAAIDSSCFLRGTQETIGAVDATFVGIQDT